MTSRKNFVCYVVTITSKISISILDKSKHSLSALTETEVSEVTACFNPNLFQGSVLGPLILPHVSIIFVLIQYFLFCYNPHMAYQRIHHDYSNSDVDSSLNWYIRSGPRIIHTHRTCPILLFPLSWRQTFCACIQAFQVSCAYYVLRMLFYDEEMRTGIIRD